MIPMTTAPPVRDLQKSYGSKALALAIGISMIFLILGYTAVCRGLVMGALFSIINFVLMAQTVHARIRSERTRASVAALGNILFRYIFMAVPVVLAIKLPRFDLFATIAGLFMVQTIILADHISRNFLFFWRK
jgi:hypothetical protein